MENLVYLAIAFAIGAGAAVQAALIGSMSLRRGPREAAWMSALGGFASVGLLLVVKAARDGQTALPAPFDALAGVTVLTAATLLILARCTAGLPAYYAATGVSATLWLVGAAAFVPKIGLALFFAAFTLGTALAALTADHVGAFGAVPRAATPRRIAGLAAVAAGVVLVRAGG